MQSRISVSLLQSSVSHNPSEIIIIGCFDAQETFLIIFNVFKAVVSFCLFVCFFRILWIECSKEQHVFEIEIFCEIINVVADTIDQFNVSLLNIII